MDIPDAAAGAAISDLIALGAHFVRLADDKRPSGYGRGADGWKSVRLERPEVESLWSRYAERCGEVGGVAPPSLGVVPSSIGLFAVDVDGEDHAEATPGEVNAAKLAWGYVVGGSSVYVAPAGVQKTMSGGAHLFYRVASEGNRIRQFSWRLSPRSNVRSPELVLSRGDTRYESGYVCVYDLGAVADAACDNDVAPATGLRLDGTATERELRRYYYPAQIASEISQGARHSKLTGGMGASVSANAVDCVDPWLTAAELSGWLSEPGARAEIESVWRWVVEQEGRKPDASQWEAGFSKAQSRVAAEERCVLVHDADADVRVAAALDLLGGRVREFDGSTFEMDVDHVWRDVQLGAGGGIKDSIHAYLTQAGVCRACMAPGAGLVVSLHQRIRSGGNQQQSPGYPALLTGGAYCVVEPLSAMQMRLGVADAPAHRRLRPIEADDLCTYRPELDIGVEDPSRLSMPSRVESELLHGTFGMMDCCIGWLLRWLSRGLEGPGKDVVFVLADSNTGKSTLAEVVARAFGSPAVFTTDGGSFDRYQTGDLQQSVFAFVDEAQNMTDEMWKALKGRVGGVRAVPRRMHSSGRSTPSRMSALLLAEREAMDFGAHRGELRTAGWHRNRFRYLLARGTAHTLSSSQRSELLSPRSVGHFVWRVLSTPPEAREECAHMGMARGYLTRMFEGGGRVIGLASGAGDGEPGMGDLARV